MIITILYCPTCIGKDTEAYQGKVLVSGRAGTRIQAV